MNDIWKPRPLSEADALERVACLRQIVESPVRAEILATLVTIGGASVNDLAMCADVPADSIANHICYMHGLALLDKGNFLRPEDVPKDARVALAPSFSAPFAELLGQLGASLTLASRSTADENNSNELERIAAALGAATECSDVLRRHLTVTLAIEPTRVEKISSDDLHNLRKAAERLVGAGLHTLSTLNPSVMDSTLDMIELVRAEEIASVRAARAEGREGR